MFKAMKKKSKLMIIMAMAVVILSACLHDQNTTLSADPLTVPDTEIQVLEKDVMTETLPYIIGAGDTLKITVFGEKDLSDNYKVGKDGTISMPLIGAIALDQHNLRSAETVIADALRNGFLKDPSVSIEVKESRPFFILGEVRRPGSYNYVGGMSILQAIAISGGFTYRANRNTVDILRGSTPAEPVSYDVEESVQAGDIIFVRERFF